MPIQCLFDVESFSKDQFHKLDYEVMRHAFDIQNKMGRLYDESIYQNALEERCLNAGFDVVSEGEIEVSHATFSKSYYLDLLVNLGGLYELKAVQGLNAYHENQLLNYMFMMGITEGKLLNFSSPSVESRFESTTIDRKSRFAYTIHDERLCAVDPAGKKVKEIALDLLADWGAYLDVGLYREAIFHFLGGDELLLSQIDVFDNGKKIGHQNFQLLDPVTGIHVSSTVRNIETYSKQLRRLIECSNLKRMLWLNFCRNDIHLIML